MSDPDSILAIIPARGGSRGLPRKNVQLMAGRPLIGWSVEAARSAPVVSRVIVSTDDQEIADAAREAGAEVPFSRPTDLAGDTATTLDVVVHALDFLASSEGYEPDWIVLLQPTSPLRIADDIEAAVRLQKKRSARAVVSVSAVDHPPEWSRRLSPDGVLLPWLGAETLARRQEGNIVYRINGAIYLIEPRTLRFEGTFFPDPTHALIMPAERSIDIDKQWDFHLANLVLKAQREA